MVEIFVLQQDLEYGLIKQSVCNSVFQEHQMFISPLIGFNVTFNYFQTLAISKVLNGSTFISPENQELLYNVCKNYFKKQTIHVYNMHSY